MAQKQLSRNERECVVLVSCDPIDLFCYGGPRSTVVALCYRLSLCFFFSRKFAIGPLQRNCHMGQKHLAGRRTTWWELEKQRDYIIQKTNVLSFQGPLALFAIQQGVFLYSICNRFVCKGPLI